MSAQILNYRGYIGSVEMSFEDNCLHGKLLFVRDLVTYEGSDPASLKAQFESAVDNYLSECERLGVPPDKTFSGTFNVRVSPELHKQACVFALECGVSLNEFVCNAIQSAVGQPLRVVNETHHHEHKHVHAVVISHEEQEYEDSPSVWSQDGRRKVKPAH